MAARLTGALLLAVSPLTLVTLAAPPDARGGARADALVIAGNAKSGLSSIGGMRPTRDASLARAIELWGQPSATTPRFDANEGCEVRWSDLGVRAVFLNLGGVGSVTACETTRRSSLDWMKISGVEGRSRWRTDRGIRVGATLRYLLSRYPKARVRRSGGERWMITGRQLFGHGCPCTVPRLFAKVSRRGKVTSLNMLVSAAGD